MTGRLYTPPQARPIDWIGLVASAAHNCAALAALAIFGTGLIAAATSFIGG